MTVSYIPFVEAIFESFEITYLNRQFFLSMFVRVFLGLLRMPVIWVKGAWRSETSIIALQILYVSVFLSDQKFDGYC